MVRHVVAASLSVVFELEYLPVFVLERILLGQRRRLVFCPSREGLGHCSGFLVGRFEDRVLSMILQYSWAVRLEDFVLDLDS